jgi:hypothetical protein
MRIRSVNIMLGKGTLRAGEPLFRRVAAANNDARGRARGRHPEGWISGNCTAQRDKNCTSLACNCKCHGGG